jgi:hypothetical protein
MKKTIAGIIMGMLILTGCKKEEKFTDEDAIIEIIKSNPFFKQTGFIFIIKNENFYIN